MAKKSIEIKVVRLYKKESYTIGKMYIDNVYFCDTIEDADRGLTQEMTLQQIKKQKVYGKTAIPSGKYKVTLTYSSKFKKTLPLINAVIGFSGVRIHSGNTAEDSLGCIIVGENKKKGEVINSRVVMEKLLSKLRGQTNINITIE